MPMNLENQSNPTVFVFLMTNFVTKGNDTKQRHSTLQLKNEQNLGPLGNARAFTPGGVLCLRRYASPGHVLHTQP